MKSDLADAIESGHVAGAAPRRLRHRAAAAISGCLTLPQVLATPHLGASTEEAQELVAVEAAEIITGFLTRNEVRHAVNMAPISAAEMADMQIYLDLAFAAGAAAGPTQQVGGSPAAPHLQFKGEAATKKTKLIASSFRRRAAQFSPGGRRQHRQRRIAGPRARHRDHRDLSRPKSDDFSTLVTATLITDQGEITAAGTVFGKQFLRLVRLEQFHLDAYLDGLHAPVPAHRRPRRDRTHRHDLRPAPGQHRPHGPGPR